MSELWFYFLEMMAFMLGNMFSLIKPSHRHGSLALESL